MMNYTIKPKDNGSFYIDARIFKDGKPYRKRETFTGTKKLAERRAVDMVRELEDRAEADQQERTGSLTYFKDCISFYESQKEVKSGDKSYLKRLRDDLGHNPIEEMPKAVEKYIALLNSSKSRTGKPFAAGTKNRIQVWIIVVLNFCANRGRIEKNPVRMIQKFKETPRDKSLTPDQVKRLFAALEEHRPYLIPIVLYAMQIPCRVSELTKATKFNLNLKAGILRINSGTTKNGNGADKALPKEMEEYFQSIPKECPWVFYRESNGEYFPLKNFNKAWRFVCDSAGLGDFRFHDLRHYAVTELVNAGLSEREIMIAANWKVNMLAVYYHKNSVQVVQKVQDILSAKVAPYSLKTGTSE